MPRLLLVSLFMVFTACSGGRGLVFDGNGVAHPDSPEFMREQAQQRLAADIARELPQLTAEVAIATLPHWREEGRRNEAGWYWDLTSVAVRVHAQAGVVVDQNAVIAVIRDHLDGAIEHGGDDLAVTVTVVEAAAPGAAQPTRTYTVQAGDTLAEICALYYGSAQPWRRIVEANPGLDPQHLVVGSTLNIPAP
jgi:LysM repeat protein